MTTTVTALLGTDAVAVAPVVTVPPVDTVTPVVTVTPVATVTPVVTAVVIPIVARVARVGERREVHNREPASRGRGSRERRSGATRRDQSNSQPSGDQNVLGDTHCGPFVGAMPGNWPGLPHKRASEIGVLSFPAQPYFTRLAAFGRIFEAAPDSTMLTTPGPTGEGGTAASLRQLFQNRQRRNRHEPPRAAT
jgi:hypothetical protein